MVHIRHAEPADVAAWARLRSALWPDGSIDEHTAEAAAFFTTPRVGPGVIPEAVFVAVAPDSGAQIIGFVEVSRRMYAEGCETSPVGFLEGWYVIPAYRRQGVGRALVLEAEVWARRLGCREFASDALVGNTESAAAHHALGFEEVEIIRCFRKDLKPETANEDYGRPLNTEDLSMDSVVHFEMPYENRERIAKFYQSAFGWKTQMLGADMNNYVLATTTESTDAGPTKPGAINGGFYGKMPDRPMQYPSVVIAVNDVTRSMEKVVAAGGKVLGEPMEIPGVGHYVSFVDPEGNRVSMLQPIPRR